MRVFFSAGTTGFYTDDINGSSYPADAIEITEQHWRQIFHEVSQGRIIAVDTSGKPFTKERPAETDEQLSVRERAWRDGEVNSNEWLATRHRDEQDMQLATTLTSEQFAELLAYRQTLRDWPQTEAFPDSAQRPIAPPWIADQSQ